MVIDDERYANAEAARALISTLLGSIQVLFDDEQVTEIIAHPNSEVWVIHRERGLTLTRYRLNAATRESVISAIASLHGVELDEDTPSIGKSMPITGERFHGVLPPASPDGPTFNIRKHGIKAMSFADMVNAKTLTPLQVDVLKRAIRDKKNIMVAGGTNSGKTTLCNTLLQYMALLRPIGRIISVEDTLELQCLAPCQLRLKVNLQTAYDFKRAVKDLMRLSPDRIVVGELRTGEATTAILESWNTGHPGGLSTIHSSSAQMTLLRIEELLMRDHTPRRLIASVIDLIVYVEKQEDFSRKVTEIIELGPELVDGQYQITSHKRGIH